MLPFLKMLNYKFIIAFLVLDVLGVVLYIGDVRSVKGGFEWQFAVGSIKTLRVIRGFFWDKIFLPSDSILTFYFHEKN